MSSKKSYGLFSFKDFLKSNDNKDLNYLDYLQAVFKVGDLPTDIIFSFFDMMSPTFTVIDDHLFIKEFFVQDEYNEYLSQGKNKDEIQFWLNLVEITGVFESIDLSEAMNLARSLKKMWNCKIQSEELSMYGNARIIEDIDNSEIFITIDKK